MVNFTQGMEELLLQMVREKLASLEVNLSESEQQQATRRVQLLCILQNCLFPGGWHNAMFDQLLDDFSIPAVKLPALPATEEESEELEEHPAVVTDSEDENDAWGRRPVARPRSQGRALDSFEPGRVYRSTAVRVAGYVIGAGSGYNRNIAGDMIYTTTNGNQYNMSSNPPGNCLNCGGNHWRALCPYATGNITIA